MKITCKLLFITLAFVAVLLQISCTKKTVETNKNSDTKFDGTFIFEANLSNNDTSDENIVSMGGAFYDKNGKVQTGGGTVNINNHELFPNNVNGNYGFDSINTTISKNGLYGTTVNFTLQTPHNNKVTASIYSPEAIYIKNVPAMTGSITLTYNSSLPITWNEDVKNANGVSISAEYLPNRYVNDTAFAAGYTAPIDASMTVNDNGSVSIPWSFFSGFPPNGHISLWISRGNYTTATDGTYNYNVGGYSAAAIWDVIIPTH